MRTSAALLFALFVLVGCTPSSKLPGVYDVVLPAACQLEIFTEESHVGERAIALACPGVDLLRLYPWPLVQPWDESPSWEPESPPKATPPVAPTPPLPSLLA